VERLSVRLATSGALCSLVTDAVQGLHDFDKCFCSVLTAPVCLLPVDRPATLSCLVNLACCGTDEHDHGQHQMKLDVITTLMFGAMAGVCAEIMTYPLEVIRRKMQLERTLASRHIRIRAAPVGTAAAAQRLVRSPLPTCLAAIKRLIQVASSSLVAPTQPHCIRFVVFSHFNRDVTLPGRGGLREWVDCDSRTRPSLLLHNQKHVQLRLY
jgi:hypothetical protein